MIWRIAGVKMSPQDVTVIPRCFALLARGVEWMFYFCTFGRVRPALKLSVLYIQYSMNPTICNICKALTRLDYIPVDDKEAHLKRAVARELENR